jgi:hypothetical protein
MADEFYAIKGSKSRTTGHLKRPGTRMTICGRALGSRNDAFATVAGWNLCTICQRGKGATAGAKSSVEIVRAITTGPKPAEPDVAQYERTDPSGQPTHPAGQQAAVEGKAAALGFEPVSGKRTTFERMADDLNRRGVPRDTPTKNLVTEMMNLFNNYEREQAAARAADGDTNPYDLAPYSDVHDLAEQFEHAREGDPADLDRFLDYLADDLDLDDVKALRTAAAAVAEAMGRIALAAREKNMSPDRIAAETGYTASRITQFIREEKQRRGDGAQ